MRHNYKILGLSGVLVSIILLVILGIPLLTGQPDKAGEPEAALIGASSEVKQESDPTQGREPFAIFLLRGNLTVAEVMRRSLDQLQLQREPFLTEEDILAYWIDDHVIEVSEAAIQRIEELQVSMSGLPFVVVVGETPIYTGAFWTSLSSLSFSEGVVIDVLMTSMKDVIKLQLGYPEMWGGFRGQDLRCDPRILEALEAAGKTKSASSTP
jgi:hypothetical protein